METIVLTFDVADDDHRDAVLPLVRALGQAFGAQHPDVLVSLLDGLGSRESPLG